MLSNHLFRGGFGLVHLMYTVVLHRTSIIVLALFPENPEQQFFCQPSSKLLEDPGGRPSAPACVSSQSRKTMHRRVCSANISPQASKVGLTS